MPIFYLKAFCIFFITFLISPVQAKHLHTEKEYQTYWCNAKGGEMEFVINDKARVDCLLPEMAVEFDFAPKWAECIGQALYYGKKTRRTPACVLIMENPGEEYRYLYQLRYTVYKKRKLQDFRTFTIKPNVLEK